MGINSFILRMGLLRYRIVLIFGVVEDMSGECVGLGCYLGVFIRWVYCRVWFLVFWLGGVFSWGSWRSFCSVFFIRISWKSGWRRTCILVCSSCRVCCRILARRLVFYFYWLVLVCIRVKIFEGRGSIVGFFVFLFSCIRFDVCFLLSSG